MKKTFLLLAFAALTTLGFAQSPAQLPTDSAVIYGKLDNGLTYYIRHNEFPEKRADFYIAQRVGSMQEEDDQAGLAHFLEHMMFNGTKNFPGKKTMLNWLETVGVKFGANANAYTSFDETVYNLSSVPVTRQGIIDSCLLVLHDWSGFASLTNEQIDEERLIIKEEWRTRNTPSLRTAEKQLSDILVGSKYANRMPIGSMDVVENFPYQTLKDYYKKWYRPDLQAIIIVGDVDAKAVEAKLKTLFADVPKPVDAAERLYFPVPDNAETIVSIALDPEATQTRVDLYLKHPLYPKQHKKTAAELTYTLLKNVATQILADRLQEIAQTADAPFVASTAFDREFSIAKTKDAWTSIAMSKENKVSESLVILVRENERIKQYGFTDAEIERAKANLLQRFETQYNNRNKTKNDEYVREYVSAFTDDEAIPGIEFEYDFVKGLLPQVNAQALNGLAKYLINDKNTVISVLGPEKEGLVYPTPDELRAVYTKAAAEKVEAYQETVSNEPLIAQLPKAGKVVKTEHDTKFGATVWTLSNGMKVVLKKTDYKDDQIVMHGLAYGGTSNFSDADFFNADMIEYVPDFGGIGNFSVTDLKKALAGKSVNGKIKVNSFSQSLEGSSTIKDVETLLQLGYLYFTAPRKDESVYNSQMAFYKNYLKNQSKEPTFILSQHLAKAKYGNNPRMQPMTFEDAEKLNYDRIIEIYRQMFANPGSFTFTFVGTIDEQALKPLVEQYLASLPSGNKKATYNKGTIAEIKTGEIADIFNQEMKAPKTTAYELYSGKLPYNQKNRLTINALKQVFDIVFQRAVRDEAGGAYGVRTSVSIRRIPSLQTTLQISFDTDPARAANITPIIGREVKKLIEHGPEAADFQKVKEYMLKQFQDDEKTNDYWRDVLTNAYFYDDDIHSNYRTILDALTPEDIQKLANELVVERNFIEVIMHPAK